MAVSPSTGPNRLRNVFITGIVVGIIFSFIVSLIMPNAEVSSADIEKLNDRLSAIEDKLKTPTPAPQASASATLTVSALNKDYKNYLDQEVTLTGKLNSPHQ